MPRIPGTDERVGEDTKKAAEATIAVPGGVAVGVDTEATVANIETKEAHIKDARLADLKNHADVYAEDWRRDASRFTASLDEPWGWDDRAAEESVKAMCRSLIDDATQATESILAGLRSAQTVADAEHSERALAEAREQVEHFSQAVSEVHQTEERGSASVDEVRAALERAQEQLGVPREGASAAATAETRSFEDRVLDRIRDPEYDALKDALRERPNEAAAPNAEDVQARAAAAEAADEWVDASARVSAEIAERIVAAGNFDPDASRFGASFFISEGAPYPGRTAEAATVDVDATVNRGGAIVISSEELTAMHARWMERLAPEIEREVREREGVPEELSLSRHQQRDVDWNVRLAAERCMWAEVAERVDASPHKVGEVVLEDSEFSRSGDGRFLVTTDAGRIQADIDALKAQIEEPRDDNEGERRE